MLLSNKWLMNSHFVLTGCFLERNTNPEAGSAEVMFAGPYTASAIEGWALNSSDRDQEKKLHLKL